MNLRPKPLFSGGSDSSRLELMATTVTPENVSGAESLSKKDPKIAYAEIHDIMKISSGNLTRILHDCLGVRKRCAVGGAHNLERRAEVE